MRIISRLRTNPLLLVIGILLEAGWLALILLGNLTQNAGQYIVLYAACFLLFGLACLLIFKQIAQAKFITDKPQPKIALLLIIFFAVLFRITTIFAAPTLSTDQFRYPWEGRLVTLGISPYRYAPNDPALLSYRDAGWLLVHQKETASPYPPLSQLLGVTDYLLFGESLFGSKIIAVVFDCLNCLALLWLLSVFGLDLRRVILYAWCPLPIVEFGQSGHNDAPMLFFLLLAIGLTAKRKPGVGAIMLGLACLAKFTPLFGLPLFAMAWAKTKSENQNWRIILRWQSWVYPLFTLLVIVAGYLPFLVMGHGAIGSILEYTGSWRDNDALLAYVLNDNLGVTIAKFICVGIVGVAIFLLSFGPRLQSFSLARRILLVFGITLLVASTVHPWYATWILVLLPLVWGEKTFRWWDRAWLLYGLFAELPYLTYAGDFSAYNWVKLLEFWPLYLAAAWTLFNKPLQQSRLAARLKASTLINK